MKFTWLLPLIFLGCSSKHFILPPTYGVDPKFTVEQVSTIESVFQAWCDAVDYCPKRDDKSLFGFIFLYEGSLGPSSACPTGKTCVVAGRNYIYYIIMANDISPQKFHLHLAHEIGHYCVKNHLETGLMVEFSDSTAPLVIDGETIKAWKEKCP